MPSYHAKLSPSSASRWTTCTASIQAQEGVPNINNDDSRNGTCCHQIAAECLIDPSLDPQDYLGREMIFWINPNDDNATGESWVEEMGQETWDWITEAELTVTQEMIDAVVSGLDFVRQVVELKGGIVEVEQRVPIGQFTGEGGYWADEWDEDAHVPEGTHGAIWIELGGGTSDVTVIGDRCINVFDFKFGRNLVMAYDIIVPAHEDIITGEQIAEVTRLNLQMACYALGAIEKYGLFGDFETITCTIVQPFCNHVSEYTCTIAELREVEEFLRKKANETRLKPVFMPTPSNCHYCRASGACDAQTQMVIDNAVEGFEDVETAKPKKVSDLTLGSMYALAPLIKDWCEAIEERVRQALHYGVPVVRDDGLGYKFVAGKRGARKWLDEAEAERLMKGMRLTSEQMYKRKLITPAVAEKFSEVKRPKKGEQPIDPVLGTTQWNRLVKQIKQSDGRPVIVLQTDPRPEVSNLDGFEDVPTADETNSDLF